MTALRMCALDERATVEIGSPPPAVLRVGIPPPSADAFVIPRLETALASRENGSRRRKTISEFESHEGHLNDVAIHYCSVSRSCAEMSPLWATDRHDTVRLDP